MKWFITACIAWLLITITSFVVSERKDCRATIAASSRCESDAVCKRTLKDYERVVRCEEVLR